MTTERFRLKSAVYLIPMKGNQILLSLRQNTGWMDGNYSLVSGHVDGNETVEEALCREAKEEAAINIEPKDLNFAHVMHRLKDDKGDEYIDFFFTCNDWRGEFVNAEPEKCGGLEWFDIDKLPDNIPDYVKYVIDNLDSNNHFSVQRSKS